MRKTVIQDQEQKEWGRFGEELARNLMIKKGYAVREVNWRPRNSHLEVDLICQKGDTIIFVEVKSRKGDEYDPAESVTDAKIRKLVRAADRYLQAQEAEFYYRFDIITVNGTFESPEVEHIEDAFLPPVNS